MNTTTATNMTIPRTLKPETRSPKPEARTPNPEPRTPNPEAGAWMRGGGRFVQAKPASC